ncbi:hypothetical protein TgHK011_000508 [Trichoderma gracile]|nr:hypothetical protein TgHK011_000508 [Trichoderma gracile]
MSSTICWARKSTRSLYLQYSYSALRLESCLLPCLKSSVRLYEARCSNLDKNLLVTVTLHQSRKSLRLMVARLMSSLALLSTVDSMCWREPPQSYQSYRPLLFYCALAVYLIYLYSSNAA